MKRSVISAIALSAAMLFSGGAFAQDATAQPTMIGSQSVSEADLPRVQAQCNTLASLANDSLGAESSTTDGADSADGASDLGDDSEVPNGTDQALATVDLALITIEDCKAAGLVQ